MEVYFKKPELQSLYTTPLDKMAGKHKFPINAIKGYKKFLAIAFSVDHVSELKKFKGLNFESLKEIEKDSILSVQMDNLEYCLLSKKQG